MATNILVESPAGERIQITDDQDWADATGVTLGSLKQWNGSDGLPGMKPMVIRALWEHGEFTSSNGRTAAEVMKWITDHFPGYNPSGQSNIIAVWNRPQNMPAVVSKTNGKRTYSLRLVALPESWHRKLLRDIASLPSSNGDGPGPVEATDVEAPADSDTTDVPTPAQIQERWDAEQTAAAEQVAAMVLPEPWTDADWAAIQLDAPTVYEEPPPLELHVANQVALSLLTTVVEIISSGSADTTQLSGAQRLTRELEQSQHLLSQRLMENDKLRRQLREAGDMITALKSERDGLRTRLRMTEHNLTEVLKGETAQAVNTEITKRIDQFMRQSPETKGDD